MAGVLVCGAVTATVPAWAGEIDLEVNKVFFDYDNYPAVIVTVKNQTSSPIKWVVVECAFLNGGSPVATTAGTVSNIRPGESAIETISSLERGLSFDSASCRIGTVLD
jgi:hypothetical protein